MKWGLKLGNWKSRRSCKKCAHVEFYNPNYQLEFTTVESLVSSIELECFMSCENEVNMLFSWCVVQSLASIFSFFSLLSSPKQLWPQLGFDSTSLNLTFTQPQKGKTRQYVDWLVVGLFLVVGVVLPRKSSKSVVSRAICNRWRYIQHKRFWSHLLKSSAVQFQATTRNGW